MLLARARRPLLRLAGAAGAAICWHHSSSAEASVSVAHTPHPGASINNPLPRYTTAQVAEHAGPGSCWIAIDGTVYDVTDYVKSHPGGEALIFQYAGRDATTAFRALHVPELLGVLSGRAIGVLVSDDAATGERLASGRSADVIDPSARLGRDELARLPSLAAVEARALALLPESLRLHIGYGAEDEETVAANRSAWSLWTLRPRVLRTTRPVSTGTTILGRHVASPVVVAPFATARAAHPDGEAAIARAAASTGCSFVCPHFGGTPLEEVRAAAGDAPLFFQLYPPRDRSGALDRAYTQRVLRHVEAQGCTAVFVTVDTPVDGNREATYRSASWLRSVTAQVGGFPPVRSLEGAGVSRHPGMATAMGWEDVAWLRSACGMKIVVKGVMTAEDAAIAAECADGIVVSNHGGRQLDGCAATAEVLRECVLAVDGRVEVFVDGGVRRGKDVFRALALGATGVLVGRPALHGLAAGGEDGVRRVLDVLQEELTTVMTLCGCETVRDVTPAHVCMRPSGRAGERRGEW